MYEARVLKSDNDCSTIDGELLLLGAPVDDDMAGEREPREANTQGKAESTAYLVLGSRGSVTSWEPGRLPAKKAVWDGGNPRQQVMHRQGNEQLLWVLTAPNAACWAPGVAGSQGAKVRSPA